ncbi:Uncharacterised protein [Aerococcus viridans]|uniref:Transposase n=2 Tax=Aerococcus viridans TaxID=1377 RepID=A0AAU8U606_9LACT|nr:hypothetical protein AWM76_06425 [Aerococcus viridans]EFG50440.1 hypothetical protein HMPREF0061_0216 [Aerococcus viridans ATCC 11563 = CCUG 4311]SUU16879.1 Uncharacterised protein [Aerococcus viridans]
MLSGKSIYKQMRKDYIHKSKEHKLFKEKNTIEMDNKKIRLERMRENNDKKLSIIRSKQQ